MTDSITHSRTRTKLQRPRAGRGPVPRPHLLERLDTSHSLTLVLAPARYGKTTLLSTWPETCNIPNAWLSRDEHDDDLVEFATYLVGARHALFPAMADDTLNVVSSLTTPPPAVIARHVLNDLAEIPARRPNLPTLT